MNWGGGFGKFVQTLEKEEPFQGRGVFEKEIAYTYKKRNVQG